MYRFLTALFVLACLSISGVALAEIPTGGAMCYAKDEVIKRFETPGLHFRKITGGDADALRVFVNNLDPNYEPDEPGFTYIVFWTMKGEQVKIIGFDTHNCAKWGLDTDKKPVFDIIGTGA